MADVKQAPVPLFDTLAYHDGKPVFAVSADVIPFVDDYKYANQFLYMYRGSEATFNAYRRELERALHWSWFIAKKSLKELRRQDIEAYIEFCQKPPLT